MDRRTEPHPSKICGFNIRTCTMAVSIINTIFWVFDIYSTLHHAQPYYSSEFKFICCIISVGFTVVNFMLSIAVLDRNIAFMKLWLKVHRISWFVVFICVFLSLVVLIMCSYSLEDERCVDMKKYNMNLELFISLILIVIWTFSIYTVNKNANFETRSNSFASNRLENAV